MDPLLSGALIALVSAAAGFLGNYLLEARRWEREDRRQHEAREHEWQLRHRDDRLELYRRFLANLPRMDMTSEEGWEAWGVAENSWGEIGLLGSDEVRSAALRLFAVSSNRADLERTIRSQEEAGDYEALAHNRQELERTWSDWVEQHEEFIAAVRRELAIDPRETFTTGEE